MEFFYEIGTVALRSILSVAALFAISRIIGERQISQLTFYDYIVGISIGSIAGIAVDMDISFWLVLTAMAVFGGFSMLVAFVTNKSIVLRRWLTGKPTVMIYNGKIIKKNLNKHHYDVNDLLLECRVKGYFDISQVQCAVMETNGQMSVLPKAEYHPVTPSDLKQPVKAEYILYNLIIDGEILPRNLKAYGRDEKWLKAKLKEQQIGSVSEVFLCVGDNEGNITAFREDEQLPHDDFFV